jgi:hypothetical protein
MGGSHITPPPLGEWKLWGEVDARQECVVRVVGISGSVADDTVTVVVLAAEVWMGIQSIAQSTK